MRLFSRCFYSFSSADSCGNVLNCQMRYGKIGVKHCPCAGLQIGGTVDEGYCNNAAGG